MEAVEAMATTLPASRIVRTNVSTREGNHPSFILQPVPAFASSIMFLGQADKKTLTPAVYPWMEGLAGH